MKINKKSWHYKVYASTFNFLCEEDYVPNTTTSCQYIRRFIMAPLYWMYAITLSIIAYTAYFFVVIYRALIGQRRTEVTSFEDDGFTPYQLPKIAGVTIYPWYLIILIILGYLCYQHTKLFLIGIGVIVAIVAALAAVVLILSFFDTETWNLIKTYYKDQERKVCRRVEFIPDESGENNPD